jgi:Fe2+ or Zn2+ uptake regulation protein
MAERTVEIMEALREAGLRCTGPRLRLIHFLADLPRHFSAEDALRVLNEGDESPVSRATLYRFLGQLERMGVLRRAQLAEGHAHYEFAEGGREHCHLGGWWSYPPWRWRGRCGAWRRSRDSLARPWRWR